MLQKENRLVNEGKSVCTVNVLRPFMQLLVRQIALMNDLEIPNVHSFYAPALNPAALVPGYYECVSQVIPVCLALRTFPPVGHSINSTRNLEYCLANVEFTLQRTYKRFMHIGERVDSVLRDGEPGLSTFGSRYMGQLLEPNWRIAMEQIGRRHDGR